MRVEDEGLAAPRKASSTLEGGTQRRPATLMDSAPDGMIKSEEGSDL